MALRIILKDNDATLLKKSRPVEKFDGRLAELLDDMTETMLAADGLGLAAPQVGVLRRVVVVALDDGSVLEMVNPTLVLAKGMQTGLEGCLSLPGLYGIVSRPYRSTVRYQDRHGNECVVSGEGLVARAFCHEINHLDGILFTQFVTEFVDTTRDDFTNEDDVLDSDEDFSSLKSGANVSEAAN